MFIQKKKKNQGISEFSEQIKEKSILYRFSKETNTTDEHNFLYCDPPEVILQSILNNKYKYF
jgi:site-specific DNA-adenine methylase